MILGMETLYTIEVLTGPSDWQMIDGVHDYPSALREAAVLEEKGHTCRVACFERKRQWRGEPAQGRSLLCLAVLL